MGANAHVTEMQLMFRRKSEEKDYGILIAHIYLLGHINFTRWLGDSDSSPKVSTVSICSSVDAIPANSTLSIKLDTPTAYILIPSFFARKATRMVSLESSERPSVITIPTFGTPMVLYCSVNIARMASIPNAVFVPIRGCLMLDNSDPSNILSPVRGISWVILELYTITPIRASPGPIWSLSIKCIRVSFSLLKSVEVMLSEPSTKKIKSTTPRQPVKYVIDVLNKH